MRNLQKITINSKGGPPLDGFFAVGPVPTEFYSIDIKAYDCSLNGIREPLTGVNGAFYTDVSEEIVARIIMAVAIREAFSVLL